MTPSEDPYPAKRLLQAALNLSAENRDEFLISACGEDAVLLAEVRGLIKATKTPPAAIDSDNLDSTIASDGSENTSGKPAGPLPGPRGTTAKPKPSISITEREGDTIGPYKLLQQIGEGGFGVVYMAEQSKPVKRRVALKIIKPGMDTREVIARFEAERQALALMDHSHIAKVLDAGATDTGRPFFAMELVKGVSITEYCDNHCLDTRQRLELFQDVCGAVQHAHQKGVIHRDIKPSNILVSLQDSTAVVKVIDFGVAKAISQELTERTLFTAFGQMIGTLQYMSPEQSEMSGLDVDTRSDIYSLGVVLYELLTGRTPIDPKHLREAGLEEIHRLIRDQEPERPSTRLTSLAIEEITALAKAHSEPPDKLTRLVRGDLDWIVMKALEKNRTRRYETAIGLAEDIRRYLDNEAVLARPPSTAYRLQKFARRNKAAIRVAAIIAAMLVATLVVSMWQAVRATKAEKRAVATLDELRSTAPAFASFARSLAEKGTFEDAIDKLDYAIKLRPDAPEYLMAKADLLQCQLKLAEASEIYRKALRLNPELDRAEASANLCEELLSANRSDKGKLSLGSLWKLCLTIKQQRRPVEELTVVQRELDEAKKLVRDNWLPRINDLLKTDMSEATKTLFFSKKSEIDLRFNIRDDGGLALNLVNTNILDLSILTDLPIKDLYLDGSTKLIDVAPLATIATLENLTIPQQAANVIVLRKNSNLKRLAYSRIGIENPVDYVFGRKGDSLEERDRAFTEILSTGVQERSEIVFGTVELPATTVTEFWEFWDHDPASQMTAGNKDEAIRMFEQVLGDRRKQLGLEHLETLVVMNDLARAYYSTGQKEKAIKLGEELLKIRRKVSGLEHLETLGAMASLATFYSSVDRKEDDLKLREEVLELSNKVNGPENSDTLKAMRNLAYSYNASGRTPEAIKLGEELLTLRHRKRGSKHFDTLWEMENLASFYSKAGRKDDAIKLGEEILTTRREVNGLEHLETLRAMASLATYYSNAGRKEDDVEMREEVLALSSKVNGPDHLDTLVAMHNLANSYNASDRTENAIKLGEALLTIRRRMRGSEHSETLRTMSSMAIFYSKAGLKEDAIKLGQEILTTRRKISGPEDPETLREMANLVIYYSNASRKDDALHLNEEILPIRRKVLGPEHPDTLALIVSLAHSLWHAQRIEESASLFREWISIRKMQGASDWRFFYAHSSLGSVLTEQKKYTEAESLLLAGHSGLETTNLKADLKWQKFSIQWLLNLYMAWGRPEEAAHWQAKLDALKTP